MKDLGSDLRLLEIGYVNILDLALNSCYGKSHFRL